MSFHFTGSGRSAREVALGGQSSHQHGLSPALRAKSERQEREVYRKRITAALRIQSWLRQRHQARSQSQQWHQLADRLLSEILLTSSQQQGFHQLVQPLVTATRAMVFSIKASRPQSILSNSTLLYKWSQAVQLVQGGQPLLFAPFNATDPLRTSWIVLVPMACRQMLELMSHSSVASSSDVTAIFLTILASLTDANVSSPSSKIIVSRPFSNSQPILASFVLEYLVKNHAHLLLSKFSLSFPVNRKASPALAPAISLCLSPFHTFQPTSTSSGNGTTTETLSTPSLSSSRSLATQTFCMHILTIPQLTKRIPLSSVTELAKNLPFNDIVQLIISSKQSDGITASQRFVGNPYFLANFLTFGSQRIAYLKDAVSIRQYLEALTMAQNALPLYALYTSEALSKLAAASDMESRFSEHEDGKLRKRHASLDGDTADRLKLIISDSHLSAVLAASNRFRSSTRDALFNFLCSIVSLWPQEESEAALSKIAHGFKVATSSDASKATYSTSAPGGLVREIWRGNVQASSLAKTLATAQSGTKAKEILSTLSQADFAKDWPPLVLLCSMYSKALITMGDDEFYPPTSSLGGPLSASKNWLTLDEVISLSALLRNLAFAMYWHEGKPPLTNLAEHSLYGDDDAAEPISLVPGMRLSLLSLRKLFTKLLQQLYARDSRRPFAPEGHWLMVSQLDLNDFIRTVVLEERELNAQSSHASSSLLSQRDSDTRSGQEAMDTDMDQDQEIPDQDGNDTEDVFNHNNHGQVLDSQEQDADVQDSALQLPSRLNALQATGRKTDSLSASNLAFLSPRLGILNHVPFMIPFDVRVEIFRQFVKIDAVKYYRSNANFDGRVRVTVRRGSIAEDGFRQLSNLGPRLKERLEITFVDQFGQPEAGIDGGGLFKEFLTSLVLEVFDTNRGLWKETDTNEIYPNPHSYATQPDQLEWYTFIGRVMGKAMYEGILVDVKFAGFFLSKMLGKQTYLDDLASLDSLDKELYRGLIYLKNYTGNVEADLALNFTVTDNEFGVSKTTELIANGADIPVTNLNRIEYIYRMSHYRLSLQIAKQCQAFFMGLAEMIDPRWLRMLNREELSVLISGTEEPIDIADLRANTVYGGYHENDPTIEYFWKALESFDQGLRKAFIKFVTSSPNPPLLGFSELNPQFGIRKAGSDVSRLPTASTCVNLLKLPPYDSEEKCREKLLYAIQSDAGFDLS